MLPSNNPYPRPELDQSERNKSVAGFIDRLGDLERKTDPKNGARSAKRKDLAAWEAFMMGRDLFNAVAGWALDHQAGLVLKDLNSVPLKTAKPPEHPDHSGVLSTNDDHRHEWYGRNWVGRDGFGFDIDPILARQWLKRLVWTIPGINQDFRLMVLWALEACDYGELQPLFRAKKKGRKVNWTILCLQMRAIALVKQGLTLGRYEALQEVAGALGVGVHTVRTWRQRLRIEFGHCEVENVLARSTFKLIDGEARYAQDLKEIARQYKLALARKKASRGKK